MHILIFFAINMILINDRFDEGWMKNDNEPI